MFLRCPFCHKLVFRWFYSWHERKHTATRDDGQMHDHLSNKPEERYAGPLDDVPQAYYHDVCGVATRMPEEIVRSYLVNPFLYNDNTFCCGCGNYVNSAELTWEETGEIVMDYMGRLRAKHLREALGLDVSDRPKGVIITPSAAKAIRKIAKNSKLATCFFSLALNEGAAGLEYHVDIVGDCDPNREKIQECLGIQIAMPKNQAKLLHGTVVDYREGAITGFTICRLYVPGGQSKR